MGFMDPAKPYEPHLWIYRSRGHTRWRSQPMWLHLCKTTAEESEKIKQRMNEPVGNTGWNNVADANDITTMKTSWDEIDAERTTEWSVDFN